MLRLSADPYPWLKVTSPVSARVARKPARRASAVDSALDTTASTRVTSCALKFDPPHAARASGLGGLLHDWALGPIERHERAPPLATGVTRRPPAWRAVPSRRTRAARPLCPAPLDHRQDCPGADAFSYILPEPASTRRMFDVVPDPTGRAGVRQAPERGDRRASTRRRQDAARRRGAGRRSRTLLRRRAGGGHRLRKVLSTQARPWCWFARAGRPA